MQYRPLVLKNYMVATLVELLGVPLAAPVARARNKFILLFQETMKEIEDERQKLLKKYGDLDKDGNLQTDLTTGSYKMRDMDGFTKEFEEMTSRALAVPCVGDELKGTFMQVKRILANLETKLDVQQSTVYGAIMDAFEEWERGPVEEASGATGAEEHAG